jgi:hypothetical protein
MWESDPAHKGILFLNTNFLLPVRGGQLFVRDTAGFLSDVVGGSEIPAKQTHLPGYILLEAEVVLP